MYSSAQQKEMYTRSKSFLTKELTADEVGDLREVIKYHEWKYGVESNPVIADYEYDQLYKKLEALEEEHPELITPDSPTQRVTSDITSDHKTVPHIVPMLSLANSYNGDDLKDFDRQIRKLTGLSEDAEIDYCVEPKFDGGSIALVYENDLLVRAATRGNGVRGEEMTANARTMTSIPLRADFSSMGIHKVELRGEAIIRKEDFDKINNQRSKEGQPLFANPRNAATGGLRTKDPLETKKRGIQAFIFQTGHVADVDGQERMDVMKNHNHSIDTLGTLGFKVPTIEKKLCKGIEEAIAFCAAWEGKRESYSYEIDGMVVKVNDYDLQKKCGSTGHHPRWAIAYKFKAKQATTTLQNVEFQIGKIGSITPVAKVAPVALAGVTVSSISMHNEEFILSKDLRIGDKVVIERAGDVIPYIVKSLADLRDGSEKKVEFPSHCPSCTTELIKEESEAAWRCVNPMCPAQQQQKMAFHVSKDAMDIDGFGRSYVERFMELGWLQDVSDVYNLDYAAISELEGFGKRSADNLQKSIDQAKRNPISRLLHSLSIHHLGKKASKIIAEHIGHVMELQEWDTDRLIAIKDIGPVVAENVVSFFSDEENVALLKRMESYGVNMDQTEEDKPLEIAEDAPLVGKTILFTGTLTQMNRKEAQTLATELGAKNISAVSSNLDILVVGEKAGSKLRKAEALGTVEIMTEAEFLILVKE